VAAVVFVVIGVVAVMGANVAVWLRQNAFDTDAYVESVRTLPQDERISGPLAEFLVDELFATIDAEDRVESVLPDRADFLAGALVGSTREEAVEIAQDIIESEQFEEFWVDANRAAHEQAVAIVHDEPELVDLENGEVTLDLTVALDVLRDQLGVVGDELFADVEIPEGQAEIVVYRSDTLTAMQLIIKVADRLAWVLPIVALASFALAIALAVRRARMVVGIGVGVAAGLGLELVITRLARTEVLDLIQDESVKTAADAAWESIVNAGFVAQTSLLITVALVVAAGAFMAAMSGRAADLGRGAVETWRQRVDVRPAVRNLRRRVGPGLAPRRGFAQVLCLAVGVVVLLLWPSITWTVLIVVLGFMVVVLGVVEYLGGPARQVVRTVSSD
jgi:hypothetical protein